MDVSSSLSSPTVVDGPNCLPPSTRFEPAGNVVDADKNSSTFEIV